MNINVVKIVVMALLAVTSSDGWCDIYKEGVASFRSTDVGVMFGKDLLSRLESKRDALYYVVSTRSWFSGKSILRVSVDEDGVSLMSRIFPDGTIKKLDRQSFLLYSDSLAFVSMEDKCYLYIPGRADAFRETSHFVAGASLRDYAWGSFLSVAQDLKLAMPDIGVAVKFRFCNGNKTVELGNYELNDVICSEDVAEKIRPILQERKNAAWLVGHKKRLNRKPRVRFGDVARIIKNHRGEFTIPYEAPPLTATSRWNEVIYDYHREDYGDHWEEWSVPVGMVEHEKVKTLTAMYNYDALRREAELFEEEMKAEKLATPPELAEDDLQYELKKGVLVFRSSEGAHSRRPSKKFSKRTDAPITSTETNKHTANVGSAAVRGLPCAFFGVDMGETIEGEKFKSSRTGITEQHEGDSLFAYFEPKKRFLEFEIYFADVNRIVKMIRRLVAVKECKTQSEAKTLYFAARYDIENRFKMKMLTADVGSGISSCSLMLYDEDRPQYGVEIMLSWQNLPGKYWTMMSIRQI